MLLQLSPDIFRAWCRDHFQTIMNLQGEIYREQPGRRTLRFSLNNKNYFAKIHYGVGWKEIVKNLAQGRWPVLSARNEWLAIKRLQDLNIPTLALVGYGQSGWNPAGLQSFILTEELINTISLEDLCHDWIKTPPSPAFKRALIAHVAQIANRLHLQGINHRDFYLCHFLLDKASLTNANNDLLIYLIDLHRTQLRKKIPLRWQIKDLGSLYFSSMAIGLTQRDKLRFIKQYCAKPLREILTQQKPFWQKVQNRAFKLYLKDKQRFIYHRSGGFNTVCDKNYFSHDLEKFLLNPDKAFESNETILLKEGDTTTVALVTIDNHKLVVKRYNIKNFWHGFRRCFKKTRAKTCWQSAHRLLQQGIATAKPVACIEKYFSLIPQKAYYISAYVTGNNAADFFQQTASETQQSSMAKHIIQLLTKLSNAQTSHGDMKATNIIISDAKPVLIDLDAMRRHRFAWRFKRAFRRDINRFLKNWRYMPKIMKLFRVCLIKDIGLAQ